MKNINISVGILTWKAHATLENTLRSYKECGLLDMVNDVCIFAQEAEEADYRIAHSYNADIIMSPYNVGIGKGLTRLVETAETDYVLLLENDWVVLPKYKDIVCDEIDTAVKFIQEGKADVVKMRSRYDFGDPLYTLQFNGREMDSPKHLFECIHWRQDPDQVYPEHIKKDNATGMYYCNSKYANQTNNPCIYRKDFYLKNISPFSGDGIDLEGKIEGWWQEQNFTVAHRNGLFTHYRIDR